jgi:hypothetical protein
MPRDPEWGASVRLVVVMAGIVAVVAIAIGIKDYVQQKHPTSTSTPTIVPSKTKSVQRKNTSAKTSGRSPMSMEGSAHAPADKVQKPLLTKTFGNADAKAQAAHDAAGAAMDRNNRQNREFDTSTTCVPLPNLTKSGDIDAPYYENWAREYGCLLLPESPPQSKPDSP